MNRKGVVGWILGTVGCTLLGYVWLTPDRPAHAASSGVYAMVSELSPGSPYVYAIDSSTGNVTATLGVSGGTSGNGVPLGSTNGRGIAVIGGTIYYTTNGSNKVYTYTISPPTDNGVLFTVTSALGGLSSVAFDGTDLWLADQTTNSAYQYTLTGVPVKTITLANASGGYVGLEYFKTPTGQGRLIANRGRYSKVYDIYDLNGNLITPAFITTTGIGTNGIAWDGTNFLIANVFNISIDTYSGTTGGTAPISSVSVVKPTGDPLPPLEDISLVYTINPTPVPTLGQWGLIFCGVLLLGAGILMSRKPANA